MAVEYTVLFWEMLRCSRFHFSSSPPPSLLAPALQAICRMMGFGSIIGKDFFKATYYGIPKVE